MKTNTRLIRFTDWDIELRFEDRDGIKVIRRFAVSSQGGYVQEVTGLMPEFVSNRLTSRGSALFCGPEQDLGTVLRRALRRYLVA